MISSKLNTLVIFTEQFTSMVKSHIPILQSLKNLQKDTLDKNFAKDLDSIISDVERGIQLDEAFSKHSKRFDSIYISMVKAGMESGSLDVTLSELNKYLKKYLQTDGKIKTALTYPVLLIVVTLFISILILIEVLPTFETLFKDSNKPLPEMTKFYIDISHFLQQHYEIIFIIVAINIAFFAFFYNTKVGYRFFDNLKLRIPKFGNLFKKSAIARFIRTFGVLIQSGNTILTSIKVATKSSKNVIMEEKIDEIIKSIEKGKSIANAFRGVEFFPEIIIQMINSGEEGGKLDELLINSADYYDDQVDNEIEKIVAIIGPVIILFMSGFIGSLIFAVFQPIFQMGEVIGG